MRGGASSIAAALLLVAAPFAGLARAADRVVTVATRPGITDSVLVVRPPGQPAAIVVVLVGGLGKLGLTPAGLPRDASGPLVTRRERLAGHGFVVAFPDAPSDRTVEGLLGFRTNREHAADVAAVIARLRRDDPVPVWLAGSSMGSVSAASAAARIEKNGPDGLVLISSVTRTHPAMRESLADVPLEHIHVPTLVLHHRRDPCEITPYDGAAALPGRLTGVKRVEFEVLDGGTPARGLPCGPESPHAFLGIEDVLVDRLASWIKRAPVR